MSNGWNVALRIFVYTSSRATYNLSSIYLMGQAADNEANAEKYVTGPTKPSVPDDDVSLRESLKRCSASTYESASQFRKTSNTEHLPAIVLGILERYVEPDLRGQAQESR